MHKGREEIKKKIRKNTQDIENENRTYQNKSDATKQY